MEERTPRATRSLGGSTETESKVVLVKVDAAPDHPSDPVALGVMGSTYSA